MENEKNTNETKLPNTEQKPEAPFKVFNTQEDFDNFAAAIRKNATDKALKNATVNENGTQMSATEYERKYRKDLETSIREQIEKEAKMTEQEKLEEQRKLLMEENKKEKIAINKSYARMLLEKAGYEEEEMEIYLDSVTEDKDVSLGRIKRYCDNRGRYREKVLSEFKTELQKSNPRLSMAGKTETDSLVAQYDEAIKNGDMPTASHILREAQLKGINLIK